MMILILALRNLARHKVKTILSVAAIAVSVAVYIFVDGWVTGMTIDSRRNIVNYETGAAKLQTKAYVEKLDDLPMYETFDRWPEYAAALDKAGYAAVPRFTFSGTLYSENASAPVMFIGIDPERDTEIFPIDEVIDMGRYIETGKYEIILGGMTADKLGLGLPQRPTGKELDEAVAHVASVEEAASFLRGLYEPLVVEGGQAFASREYLERQAGSDRWRLRPDVSKEELDKAWALFDAAGRTSARISTVIDIKAPPETISYDKFNAELEDALTPEELSVFNRAYIRDDIIEAWYLSTVDKSILDAVLASFIRVDFSGAIRHINQVINVTLAGTINAPDPQLNNNMAYIPLDVLQDDTGMMLGLDSAPGGKVTELAIRKKGASFSSLPGSDETTDVIAKALETNLEQLATRHSPLAARPSSLAPSLQVFPWEEYCKDFMAVSAGDTWSTRIMVAILFVLSFLGIANTMLLAILERTKEVGMMRAMGMTGGELTSTMMTEAGLAGLIGSSIGVVLGVAVNAYMVKYGLALSAMTESMGGDIGYRVNGIFKAAWNIPVIVGCGIIGTLLSACMAFFPTRRVIKQPVTESIRFE